MELTAKQKYKYLVKITGNYITADAVMSNGAHHFKFSQYKSDAKQYDSILEARQLAKEIGGSVDRYNVLTGETVDIEKLVRENSEGKRWSA